MKLIVGLGNPGKPYEHNRHNVGFQIVDLLAARHALRFDIKRGKAQAALGAIGQALPAQDQPLPELGESAGSLQAAQGTRLVLAKPQTFMNLVGPSVASLMRFYKISLADLLVIYDDLDLPLGVVRLRPAGGSGGHNGMRSIMQALGSGDFARLRVGIDRPPGQMDPADYVLQDFSTDQEAVMGQRRELAADACEHWLARGIASAMNAYNVGPEQA